MTPVADAAGTATAAEVALPEGVLPDDVLLAGLLVAGLLINSATAACWAEPPPTGPDPWVLMYATSAMMSNTLKKPSPLTSTYGGGMFGATGEDGNTPVGPPKPTFISPTSFTRSSTLMKPSLFTSKALAVFCHGCSGTINVALP